MGYYEGVIVKCQAYSERIRVLGSRRYAIEQTRHAADRRDAYSVFTKDGNLIYSAIRRLSANKNERRIK